jgi:hypothetical protein
MSGVIGEKKRMANKMPCLQNPFKVFGEKATTEIFLVLYPLSY